MSGTLQLFVPTWLCFALWHAWKGKQKRSRTIPFKTNTHTCRFPTYGKVQLTFSCLLVALMLPKTKKCYWCFSLYYNANICILAWHNSGYVACGMLFSSPWRYVSMLIHSDWTNYGQWIGQYSDWVEGKSSSFKQTKASLMDLSHSLSCKNISNSQKRSRLETTCLPRGLCWLWNKFEKMGFLFMTWGNWKINRRNPPTHSNANSHEQMQVENKKMSLPLAWTLASCYRRSLL